MVNQSSYHQLPDPDPVRRISVQIPEELYEKLRSAAKLNRRSMSAQAAISLERDLRRTRPVTD